MINKRCHSPDNSSARNVQRIRFMDYFAPEKSMWSAGLMHTFAPSCNLPMPLPEISLSKSITDNYDASLYPP